MKPAHRRLPPFRVAGLLVLGGCAGGGGSRTPTADPSGADTGSATPGGSAAPSGGGSASPFAPGTATPTGSPTPGSTPVGTGAATPGGTLAPATVAPSSCPTVNPIRVNRAEAAPRR